MQQGLNIEKHSKEIKKLLEIIRKSSIFQYNKPYLNIFDSDLTCCGASEMGDLTKLALEREKSKIINFENCYFIGEELSYAIYGHGIASHSIRLISGEPCELLEIGIGRSMGQNSSLFIFQYFIKEDNKIIYNEEIFLEVPNRDSKISEKLVLRSPIQLKNGRVYEFCYLENVDFQYCLTYPRCVIDFGMIKIKHEEFKMAGSITLYLKINKITKGN